MPPIRPAAVAPPPTGASRPQKLGFGIITIIIIIVMMIENAKAHKSHSSGLQGGVAVVGFAPSQPRERDTPAFPRSLSLSLWHGEECEEREKDGGGEGGGAGKEHPPSVPPPTLSIWRVC